MTGLLTFFFSIVCILTILLILIQKGKGSLGMGNIGGSNQMLFGGSGGQDFFQKLTWFFGAILLAGSLGLALLKTKSYTEKTKFLDSVISKNSKKAVQDMTSNAPSTTDVSAEQNNQAE